MSDGGKGDKRRPASVSQEELKERWDLIFKKPPSCLDSAFEREAVKIGLETNPVFPENKVSKGNR